MNTTVIVKETRTFKHLIRVEGQISECAADLIAGRFSRRCDIDDQNDIADLFAESNMDVIECLKDQHGNLAKLEWIDYVYSGLEQGNEEETQVPPNGRKRDNTLKKYEIRRQYKRTLTQIHEDCLENNGKESQLLKGIAMGLGLVMGYSHIEIENDIAEVMIFS